MPSKTLKRPLARLFGPATPPPPSTKERIAALDSSPPEVLAALALSEDELALRAAAIERLADGECLRALAGLGAAPSPSAELAPLAQQRLATLIDSGALDWASLSAHSTSPSATLSVAERCAISAPLEQVVASIREPQEIARLVLEGGSLRLRQLAAQRVEDREELNRLLKQLQGKEKSVYRILKDKRDALKAESQRTAQIDQDIRALCASLEALAAHPFDALFAPAFEAFAARWRALENQAQPWARERAGRAIDRCQEILTRHVQAVEQEAARLAEQSARAAAMKAAREEAVVQATEEARRREEAASLEAAEAAKLREAERCARDERLAAEALAARQLAALIAKAQGALRDGHTGPAAGLRRAIEERLAKLPTLPPPLARQLQDVDAKLTALKGWKDYAVTPKRAELIAEMEALIGATESPKKLAERIKDLRAQWKTISQGVLVDSEADWERFNQAALSAYEPCRKYFEAQAALRAENLARRMLVLERLRTFEANQDVDRPDWREIGAALYEAPQEWRRIAPVDRVAVRAAQEEFEGALGRLRGRLEAWHAQNAADKRSLIERAQALLGKEDGREAVEGAKVLQRQWRDIGPAARELEGPLWNEFREHCDAVFKKRQQAYVEYEAQLETNKAQVLALCAQVEQAASQTGAALLEGAKSIPQWRASFDSWGELPRTEARALYARFERAVNLCEGNASQQRARDAAQVFENLLEAARHIHAYGRAVAEGAAPAESATLKAAAESFIAGVPQWPKGGAAALKDCWTKAETASRSDAAINEAALRLLCIRSEIHGDRPTPAEDQDVRRSYQLQRLVQGMGRGEASANDWESLTLEWVRVGPAPADTTETLLARFRLGRRK